LKKMILLTVVFLSTVVGTAQAEEGQLGVTFNLTYVSRWMIRGSQVWDDSGSFFETIDLDLWSTCFGVSVIHRSAAGSSWLNKHRND